MDLGLWILHGAGSLQGLSSSSLLTHVPRPDFSVATCHSALLAACATHPGGCSCMCRFVPVPSSLAIWCLSTQSLPSFLSNSQLLSGPSFPWLQTQGQSAIPSCMPPLERPNNMSPHSVGVWRLHSHIPWSHPCGWHTVPVPHARSWQRAVSTGETCQTAGQSLFLEEKH